MSKVLRTSLLVIGGLVAGAVLIMMGMTVARSSWASPWGWHGYASPAFNSETSDAIPYPHSGMMRFYSQQEEEFLPYGIDPGMMGGYGMMGGPGMMNGSYGMMGGMGMKGGFSGGSLLAIDPISLSDAEAAVEDYLAILQDENLEVGEIMIFDNHAYAQIVEADTGIGAIEVLVDPVTLSVSPEPGPTMMWNLKYSPMAGFGGFGMMGMMGTFRNQTSEPMDGMREGTTIDEISPVLPLTSEDAIEVAQRYLDVFLPGTKADEHADPFYGYYTIHILRKGEIVGMLSVNGFTRQVLVHNWHGTLLSSSYH